MKRATEARLMELIPDIDRGAPGNLSYRVLEGLDFSAMDLSGVDFSYSTIRNCELHNVRLRGVALEGATVCDVRFTEADISSLRLSNSTFTGCDFTETDLRDSQWTDVALTDCVLDRAALDGASFSSCRWTGVSLRGTRLSETTRLRSCDVSKLSVDGPVRDDLLHLRVLLPSQASELSVDDELISLRLAYGGPKRMFHTVALALFIVPHLVFLIVQSLRSFMQTCTSECNSIWKSFGKHVLEGWYWWFSLILFVFLCFFNTARLVLLARTRLYEHQREISGLPLYIRKARWVSLLVSVQGLWWINLLASAILLASGPGHGNKRWIRRAS